MWASLNDTEVQALLWIQEHLRNDFLTPVFRFITRFGDGGIFWIVVCLLLLLASKTRREIGIPAAMSLALNALVTNVFLKNMIGRIRPYDWVTNLQILTAEPHDFSFPSGHSAASFSVAMAICLSGHKKAGTAALVFAALIAVSRLYLGVHYPTDVLGGALIGCLSALIIKKLYQGRHRESAGE